MLHEEKLPAKMETRDVFLCHASEDKAVIVEPLVIALKDRGLSYWYDNAEITWGDSITEKVNDGLIKSRYVLVVLSPEFMKKRWPQRELYSALNIEVSTGEVRVLPLLCGSTSERKAILEKLPLLNDKFYITWSGNPNDVISALLDRLARRKRNEPDSLVDCVPSYPKVRSDEVGFTSTAGTVHPPEQNVSLYLLGEDYLRIGWLFLAVGAGGVFATPAFMGLNISMRTVFGFALLVLPATWTGIFLMLTGKYYKEAGHRYPSLNYKMRPPTILIPMSRKWKLTLKNCREYREIRLAMNCYTCAFVSAGLTMIGGVFAICLAI